MVNETPVTCVYCEGTVHTYIVTELKTFKIHVATLLAQAERQR